MSDCPRGCHVNFNILNQFLLSIIALKVRAISLFKWRIVSIWGKILGYFSGYSFEEPNNKS